MSDSNNTYKTLEDSVLIEMATGSNFVDNETAYDDMLIDKLALERIKSPLFDTPIISTNIKYLKITKKFLLKYRIKKYTIILEPLKKNTSAAILSSVLLDEIPYDQPMIFFPADHLIEKSNILIKGGYRRRNLMLVEFYENKLKCFKNIQKPFFELNKVLESCLPPHIISRGCIMFVGSVKIIYDCRTSAVHVSLP